MPNRFRISSTVLRKLEELNVPPRSLLAHARLPASLLQQAKVQVTTEEMFAFYRAASEVSGDPGIGLKIGTEERAERYDPIAIAALCTRSLRDALQRMARYKQLTCPEKIELIETTDECAVRFDWLLAQEQEPAALIDTCFCLDPLNSATGHGCSAPCQTRRVPAAAGTSGDVREVFSLSGEVSRAAESNRLPQAGRRRSPVDA